MTKTCKHCGAEFTVTRRTRQRVLCESCAAPQTHEIDGKPMTMAEIRAACPGIAEGTLVSRIKWGWNTLEQLRQPVLPGRNSPWRKYRKHWLSKRGAAA